MERSETINNLTKSLALFHVKVGKISKDAKNPFFKSNYASLPHILKEIQEPLQESGLVITQFPDGDGLVTLLIHAESGEYLSSHYVLQVVKQNDPQAQGSAISYARRYAITSILNLAIDDDDAEKATAPIRDQYTKMPSNDNRKWLNPGTQSWSDCVSAIKGDYTIEDIQKKYRISQQNITKLKEEASI